MQRLGNQTFIDRPRLLPLLALLIAASIALTLTSTNDAHAQDEDEDGYDFGAEGGGEEGLAPEGENELTFDEGDVPEIYRDVGDEDDVASPFIGNDEEALEIIYGDDPVFGTMLKLERHLGIYLVRYPQRDESERLTLDRRSLEAEIWVSIGAREENDLACKLVRWLVFGRTRWAKGARGVFSEFRDLNDITLRFTNVRLRDGRRGRVKKKIYPVIEATLTRADFEKIDIELLEDTLAQGECVEAAGKHLSRYRFHNKYFTTFKDNQ